jgi:hypothetical protein
VIVAVWCCCCVALSVLMCDRVYGEISCKEILPLALRSVLSLILV